MNFVRDILGFVRSLLAWWFVVEPWEQAIRVRFGKNVRLFEAGIHVKIPFFDVVYTQNVRRRISDIPLQTMTTMDGKTMTIHGSIGYKILDVMKLHMTLHDAERSVQQEIMGHITHHIVNNNVVNCRPADIIDYVKKHANLEQYGLGDMDFFLTGMVSNVPTFRLIQDSIAGSNMYHSSLTTNDRSVSPPTPY